MRSEPNLSLHHTFSHNQFTFFIFGRKQEEREREVYRIRRSWKCCAAKDLVEHRDRQVCVVPAFLFD